MEASGLSYKQPLQHNILVHDEISSLLESIEQRKGIEEHIYIKYFEGHKLE